MMWLHPYPTHFLCESHNEEVPLHLLAECPHANRCQDCVDNRPCPECRADGREDGRL